MTNERDPEFMSTSAWRSIHDAKISKLPNFAQDIDVAAWIGKQAADGKNEGNMTSFDSINTNLMAIVDEAPEKFRQAIMTAYTVAYVKNLRV